MADTLAQILLIFGNQLAYRIGCLLVTIFTIGRSSIEPLPSHYPAHYVQTVEDNQKVASSPAQSAPKSVNPDYTVVHETAMFIGYAVLIITVGLVLYHFRGVLLHAKVSSIAGL